MIKERYLGDGVYARFDGYQLRLQTVRDSGKHVIYLDSSVLVELERYIGDVRSGAAG
jgi:hypothetical protein